MKKEINPKMKPIIELAERLIEEQGQDRSSLAKKLGFTSRYLADIKSGKCQNPGYNFILSLINNLNFNPRWLATGEGEAFLSIQVKTLESVNQKGFKQVPVYSESDLPEGSFIVPLLDQRLSAGSGAPLPERDETSALIPVPAYLSRYGDKIAALTVDGDSMFPTLSRGDIVVCDSFGYSGDGVYAIRDVGEKRGFVKRIAKESGKFVIISDNKFYEKREVLGEDIEVIGRVHCAIKKVE